MSPEVTKSMGIWVAIGAGIGAAMSDRTGDKRREQSPEHR